MGAALIKKRLSTCDKMNTGFFQFNNKKFYCKVVDIYDGDRETYNS